MGKKPTPEDWELINKLVEQERIIARAMWSWRDQKTILLSEEERIRATNSIMIRDGLSRELTKRSAPDGFDLPQDQPDFSEEELETAEKIISGAR